MVTNLGLALDEMKKAAKTEGKLEGEREGMLKAARKMLLRNMNINTISDVTGLSVSEIEELKKKIKQ